MCSAFSPLRLSPCAARRLAVDGDDVVPLRPERRDPALETAPEQDRIYAVGNAEVNFQEAALNGEMALARAAISPKSSQEQIVVRGRKSRTSAREYMTRYDERSSASLKTRSFIVAFPRNRDGEAFTAQQDGDLARAPHRIVVAIIFDGTRQLVRPAPPARPVRAAAFGLGLFSQW
ncbi:MAG: hypothetical protein ACT4O2_04080 [Beijerinckiaceae bacterium]